MRPTIRGWTVVAVVAASVAMAWRYGPQALNALVTPLLVVLVVGAITIVRANRPVSRRAPVAEGFVGDERTVEVALETSSIVSATVRDTVGDGLSVTAVDSAGTATIDDDGSPVVETTLTGDDRFGYTLRLEDRGDRRVGPLTITVSDVFGLFERRFTDEETTSVLVYPPVHELRSGPGRDLRSVVEDDRGDREEFDHLREYQRGDSLRDINWKSAAKRPDADLVVTEYVTDEEIGSTTVAAECTPGYDDELATAVASVATHLLEADVSVGVTLPRAHRPPGSGGDHRRDLLGLCAVLEPGELEDRQRRRADVLVQADTNGTRVVVDGRTIPFDRLTGARNATGRYGRSARGRADGEPGVVT